MISNTANSTLTTNFNVTPYYDDYQMNNEYYRILFKPGYAVQSRELTQMQSMIQSQIKRFGVNIFKEGSLVIPGQFTFRVNVNGKKGTPIDYVKIKPNDASNNSVNVSSFLGQTITGQTNSIRAQVTHVLDTDGTTANTKTLYVTYLGASPANSAVRKFTAGEPLVSRNVGTCIVNDANTTPIGYASAFTIDEGVLFAKDHFIYFPTQEVILDRYNPSPTCKVGFFLSEDIIDANEDSSLLDPALESSNYAAPGADRLRLSAQLSVVDYDFEETNDFVTLFTMNEGVLRISNDKTQYNILGDTMASRTYDESGDYVVRGFNVQISEHDRVTFPVPNNGRYENGNNQNLVVSVDAGHGYVKGYSVTNNDKTDIVIPKARTYANVEQQILSTTMGSYVTVNELVGSWIVDVGSIVKLYDVPNVRITNEGFSDTIRWSVGSAIGNEIGYATFNGIEYVGGTPGFDATYNIYLTDIVMDSARSFRDVRSLYVQNATTAAAGADVVLSSGVAVLQDVINSPMLFYTGSPAIRSIRNPDGSPSVDYFINRTAGVSSAISISTSGILTVNLTGPTNERLPYGTTTLSDTDKRQDLILTCGSSINIGPLWGSTVSASGTTVNGSGTYFTRLNVGDKLEFSGLANTFYIAKIVSDTKLELSTSVPNDNGSSFVTSNSVYKAYKAGDIIDLTGVGSSSGAQRTVTATPTSLSIDLKENFPIAVANTTLTYKLYVTNASEAVKKLKTNRLVKINCATAGVTGPYYLGFSDVYAIRKIVKKNGSSPSSMTDGTDVTKFFTLNNGQKDTHYDIAFIQKSGALAISATDYLMIELDYFEPDYSGKGGFFTIDSYPIQDNDNLFNANNNIRTENIPVYVSNGSTACDLKNYIDFRPVKRITAIDSTSPSTAATNPASTTSSYYMSGNMKTPVPSSDLTYNYSYYLGRSDIVVVTKDNTIAIVQGVPGENPVPPNALETQMLIAILDIAPYPSLSPFFANALRRRDLACKVTKTLVRGWTMKDIGGLEKRIQNLEYYASLTLLEKDAVNLKVLDDFGQERFKNGIFVDTFRDTTLSAKDTNPDFRIVTDPIELAIRPLFTTESIPYKIYSATNAVVRDGLVMFPYTETLLFEQNRVTDIRNIERGTYLFAGQLKLTPSQDVWVDTTQLPDETLSIASSTALLSVGITVGSNLSLTGANNTATVSNATLLVTSTNNESYFTNTTIGIATPNIGAPIRATTTTTRYEVIQYNGSWYYSRSTFNISIALAVAFRLATAVSLNDPNVARDTTNGKYYYYPNGVPRAPGGPSLVGYYARGASSNTIKRIVGVKTDTNGTLISLIVEPTTSFLQNEKIDIWSTLDFGYPPIGTSRPPYTYNPNPDFENGRANGFTGISTQAISVQPMYDHKISVNDMVRGVSSGANARITSVMFDKQNIIRIDTSGLNVTANTTGFTNGEALNFYWNSNAAYMQVSSSIASHIPNFVKYVDRGDIVKGVTSGSTGSITQTLYSGASLIAVTTENPAAYTTGESVDIFFSNNTYKGVSATISSISAAAPPSSDVDVRINKSLINTEWENWKSNITGYALYRGSGTNKTKVGVYATAEEARAIAKNWTAKQGGGTATLETVYNNTRVGKNWFAQTSSDSAVGSNKVLSSQTIPYIRPQIITVQGTGLKPFSKMSVWFDGVNVTNYCTPLTFNQYNESANNTPITPDGNNYSGLVNVENGVNTVANVNITYIVPDPVTGVANSSCPLIVRDTGDLYFRFQISGADDAPKFRTGSRRLVIMDSSQANPVDITDEEDASTIASNYFFADGTKQTLQRTVYSTKGYLKTSEDISQQFQSNTQIVLPNTWSPPPPPKGHCCFDPNAKVLMADMTWKAIKDIVVGDEVIGDNGVINKVTRNKTIEVGNRDMYRFRGANFWTTDDHLFLTKSGYKTWKPQVILNDPGTDNGKVLVGENQHTPLRSGDNLKMVDIVDGKLVDKFVSYDDVAPEKGDFDPSYIVHDLSLDGNFTYIVEGYVVHNCCVAYSVLVQAPQDEEGVFCTGFDVFVARKSATRRMWFEVREIDNGGRVTNSQVPGSVVYVENADIPVSPNGNTDPVQVKFSAPIHLMNNREYAFIVHTFSPSYMTVDPDTYVWISRLGEIDRNTGNPVNDRMKTGTFFTTTNNKQWEAIQDVDLTIKVYRAAFTPGTATVILGNNPVEKVYLKNASSSFRNLIGDHFSTGDTLLLTGANGSFSVGNRIVGKSSGSVGTILSIPSGTQIRVSNTFFRSGETIDVYNGNVYARISASVSAVSNSTAVLSYVDETSPNVYFELVNSTGGFKVDDLIVDVSSGSQYSANIASIENYPYSASSFEPKVLDFLKTDLRYEMATVSNNSTTLGDWIPIVESETFYWPDEKVIYSRSDELNSLGGIPSNQVKVTMTTLSEYVTPVLDLDATHSIIIDNIVNDDTSGEDGTSGGNAINKYISQTVTLADGQDAEDIKVYLTAYRPPGTDVKVYVKVKNVDDPAPIESKNWIELIKESYGDNLYSSVANRLDFKEFSFTFSPDLKTGNIGEFQYESNGTVFTSYKYFTIKIVLTATNPAVVPRVADLRAMAMQI